VQRLKDAGVHDLLVSVHGLGDVHDYAVGVQGAHEKQMRALRHCQDVGVPFRFNTVLHRAVLPQLEPIAELAIELGVEVVNFIAFNGSSDQKTAGVRTRENVPRYSEIAGPLGAALDRLRDARIEANVRYLPFCVMPSRHLPSLYNHQQIVWDPNDWHYPSFRWTNEPAQRIKGVPLSDPLAVHRPTSTDLTDRLWKKKRMAKVFGRAQALPFWGTVRRAWHRADHRLTQLRQKPEALYPLAREFAVGGQHRHAAKCEGCQWRAICDGPHGDYVDLHGDGDLRPAHGEPISDPREHIQHQLKVRHFR
jgi:MoaA/NifB/PqqE/SkfB family radical SAM enzyme